MRTWMLAALLCLTAGLAVAPARATEVPAGASPGAAAAAPDPQAEPAPEPDAVDDEYDPFFDEEFDLDLEEARIDDPLEDINRHIFAFNQVLDDWAFDPTTRAYQFIAPSPCAWASTTSS